LAKEKINRIGETGFNKMGSIMHISKYHSSNNIEVYFPNSNYLVKTSYNCFLSGSIKNPMDKTLFNIGYIGIGKYKVRDEFNKSTKIYSLWHSLLSRCYSKKFQIKKPTYIGCSVCEEWHNFQNFGKWCEDNYYEVKDQIMHLDKDILLKGNKIYSPETCIFVPLHINEIFTKRQNHRGNYPIGVSVFKGKFRARCNTNTGLQKTIGLFNTPEEAFTAYKKYKENYIKYVAIQYKYIIPIKLYNALMIYEVNIND